MGEEIFYGEVCWFNKTYGFITWDNNGTEQADLFVHWSDVVSEGYRTLFKGQKVSFKIGTNKHGQPKAIEVTVLRN